jgi:hypothetical protein
LQDWRHGIGVSSLPIKDYFYFSIYVGGTRTKPENPMAHIPSVSKSRNACQICDEQ